MIQLLQKKKIEVILSENGIKRNISLDESDNCKKVLLNECGDTCGVYCTFNASLFKTITNIMKTKWHMKKDMWTISINDLPKLINFFDINKILWEFQKKLEVWKMFREHK